jgi:hypothetical protein
MVRRIGTVVLTATLGLALATAGGCGGARSSYIHPNVDFSYMKRAAVLPFRNLSNDEIADERIQSIFMMELLRADVLEILDPRETVAGMRAAGVPIGAELTAEQAVRLGEALGVDALLFGSVEEYGFGQGDRRRGPEVTVVFGMTETQTGVTVWRVQVHETGSSLWRRLFSHGTKDLFTVSHEAVRRGLGSLLE